MKICELSGIENTSIIGLVDELDIDFLIGRNLRRLRELRGLSQDDLADKMTVSKQRISGIETGREGMGKDVMARACKALEVHPWEFYVDEKTPCVLDEKERQALYMIREAEKFGVAEDVAEYARFKTMSQKRETALLTKVSRVRRSKKLIK
jgi:transcriptional regulator with XRE-family HTH domain